MKRHDDSYQEREYPRGTFLFTLVLSLGIGFQLVEPWPQKVFNMWVILLVVLFLVCGAMKAKDDELVERYRVAKKKRVEMMDTPEYGKWLRDFDKELYHRWLEHLGISSWREAPVKNNKKSI